MARPEPRLLPDSFLDGFSPFEVEQMSHGSASWRDLVRQKLTLPRGFRDLSKGFLRVWLPKKRGDLVWRQARSFTRNAHWQRKDAFPAMEILLPQLMETTGGRTQN